ncbi:hypothetical protein CspHIS471_0212660 [Cutaneotrichosporon sp. HIS471]|nr:hypothetical protein CspHIS471_0212660 [Cutaneotrichosporon sp. HIS471]
MDHHYQTNSPGHNQSISEQVFTIPLQPTEPLTHPTPTLPPPPTATHPNLNNIPNQPNGAPEFQVFDMPTQTDLYTDHLYTDHLYTDLVEQDVGPSHLHETEAQVDANYFPLASQSLNAPPIHPQQQQEQKQHHQHQETQGWLQPLLPTPPASDMASGSSRPSTSTVTLATESTFPPLSELWKHAEKRYTSPLLAMAGPGVWVGLDFPDVVLPDITGMNFDDWDQLPECLRQVHRKDNKPSRPMNAYFIYMKFRRSHLSRANRSLITGELSTVLGAEWRSLNDDRKAPWRALHRRLAAAFKRKFPDYQYERESQAQKAAKKEKTQKKKGGTRKTCSAKATAPKVHRVPRSSPPRNLSPQLLDRRNLLAAAPILQPQPLYLSHAEIARWQYNQQHLQQQQYQQQQHQHQQHQLQQYHQQQLQLQQHQHEQHQQQQLQPQQHQHEQHQHQQLYNETFQYEHHQHQQLYNETFQYEHHQHQQFQFQQHEHE